MLEINVNLGNGIQDNEIVVIEDQQQFIFGLSKHINTHELEDNFSYLKSFKLPNIACFNCILIDKRRCHLISTVLSKRKDFSHAYSLNGDVMEMA